MSQRNSFKNVNISKIGIRGFTCAAEDTGVTLSMSVRHNNTKLNSMSVTNTLLHVHCSKARCASMICVCAHAITSLNDI